MTANSSRVACAMIQTMTTMAERARNHPRENQTGGRHARTSRRSKTSSGAATAEHKATGQPCWKERRFSNVPLRKGEGDRGVGDDGDMGRAKARMDAREPAGRKPSRPKAKIMRGELRISLVTKPKAEIGRARKKNMCGRRFRENVRLLRRGRVLVDCRDRRRANPARRVGSQGRSWWLGQAREKIERGTVRAGFFTSPLGMSATSIPRRRRSEAGRCRQRVASRPSRPTEVRRLNEKDSRHNEDQQRQQFRDRYDGDCARASAHAANVDEDQNPVNQTRVTMIRTIGLPNNGNNPATESTKTFTTPATAQIAVRQIKNAGQKSNKGPKRDLDISVEPTGQGNPASGNRESR